jgi:hypothetical protein
VRVEEDGHRAGLDEQRRGEEGTTVEGLLARSLTEADRDLLAALASRVSPQSMISRFHGAVGNLPPSLLDRLLDLAPVNVRP